MKWCRRSARREKQTLACMPLKAATKMSNCILVFGYVVERSPAQAGHIMHGNIGHKMGAGDPNYGATSWSTLQQSCNNCFGLIYSNITSVQSNVIEVLGASKRGVHA